MSDSSQQIAVKKRQSEIEMTKGDRLLKGVAKLEPINFCFGQLRLAVDSFRPEAQR